MTSIASESKKNARGDAWIWLILFILIFATRSFGQAVSGNIVGTITDSSGGAVPGAAVVITDLDHGTSYNTKTNPEGNYSQTHLLAGHYQVQVTAAGFAQLTATAIVQVDQTTQVNGRLDVSAATTDVLVTAQAPLLITDRAEVSTTLTSAELEKLPVLDRNVTNLMATVPGSQMSNGQISQAENPQGGIGFNVNGQIAYSNGFDLDGTENHSNILGAPVINPDMDSLQEFKVTTSNYDAEFGNVSGALLQATTKSGTNQLHGSLFEYLRNNKLNAINPFTGTNPPLHWNQFGGSVGGPLKKDKLFGFFDYDGTRRRTGASVRTTVPNAAERNGDLTGFLGQYICADGSASSSPCATPFLVQTTEGNMVPARGGMVFDPTTGDSSGNGRRAISTGGKVNVITPAPGMQKLLGFLPAPNFGAPGQISDNFIGTVTQIFDTNQEVGRVDYNISDKMHFFGRYSIAGFTLSAPGAFGAIAGGPTPGFSAGQATARNQNLSLDFTYTFSPTLITDMRFGAYRYRIRQHANGVGTTPATDAGILGLNLGTADTSGMPAFYVNGNGGFNFGYSLGVNSCNCPLAETNNSFQWVDMWTKLAGNHTVKWGADIHRVQQTRIDSSVHRAGEISFSDSMTGSATVDSLANGSATTGSAMGSYLLGQPNNIGRFLNVGGFYPSLRQSRLFFFVQDGWRVTPKLTVDIGLRYENYLPQVVTKAGSGASFDPNTGEVVVGGFGTAPRNFGVKPYNWGFAPRLGIAYQLQPKTVIRTGFARSFNAAGVGAVFAQNPEVDPPTTTPQQFSAPNSYVTALPTFLTTGTTLPPLPNIGSNGRYPLPDGVGVYFFFDPLNSYRIPLSDAWNFSVQRELASSLTLDVGYVGNIGRHLFLNRNRNQAVPGPGDFNPRRPFFQKFGLTQGIYDVCNCDNSNYNSLQVKLQKRVSRGLDFLVTYTWAKAITNGEGGYGFADNYNVRGDYGPASFDRTHALSVSHNWELPIGKGRRYLSDAGKVADGVLGGWRFSGVSTVYSGQALTPSVSNAPQVNADFNQVRPDLIGNYHVPNPNEAVWFNPAAYISPQQPYRQGTASKGSLRGPGQTVLNLSLSKSFAITESKTLEFRWENFNALNHLNLGNPNTTIDQTGAGGAGTITYAATNLRIMQFGLHFRF